MNKSLITEQQREEADDAGFAICEECATSYMPAPGFMNDGHQCNENGLEDRFILPECGTSSQRA